ncbi:MAG: hypothetical protein RBJ76_13750 [Stenomitos frigidus ULC029]
MTYDEFHTIVTTALASDIGTYTTPSGATVAAIWEHPPQTPPNWKVSGLEVVFQKRLEVERDYPVTGGIYTRAWWVVRLVQWDVTTSTEAATDKLRFHPSFGLVRHQDIPETDLTYDQTIIKVFNPDLQPRL